MVEAGSDRTISPGQPTPANHTYVPNPLAFGGNLPVAIATGLDNGLQDIGIGRPLGTTMPQIIKTPDQPNPQGAYGVGGPPVTPTPTASEQDAAPTQQQMSVNSQPEADVAPPSDKKPKPKLNLIKTPLVPEAGDTSRPSTPAATSSSEPKRSDPVAAAPNDVASSIKSALSGLSKVGAELPRVGGGQ